MSMQRYMLSRLSQALLTIITVLTISFALIQLLPGGPIGFMIAQLPPGEPIDVVYDMIDREFGFNPDDPLYVQYFDWVGGALTGDLGMSFWYNRPVSELVAEALPWTIFIILGSVTGAFAVGISVGALMAFWERSRFDVAMTYASIVSLSVPYYVFALLLIGTLSFRFGLFPAGGRFGGGLEAGANPQFLASVVYHAILPILSMQLGMFGGRALEMRGNSIQVLGSDYMRVAQLRGLSTRRITFRYVTKNAILPLYTGFMIMIVVMFSGVVVLETIFQYRGIGFLMITAFESRDHFLLMGVFIVITVVAVIALFIADLTYGLIDPRIKTGGGGR